MLKYLKAAFWAAPEIAGLGRIPVNAVGLIGIGILGFGHPGFWLVGAGLETAYFYLLVMNDRFRTLVDSEERHEEHLDVAAQRNVLVNQLIPPSRARLEQLEKKCGRILELNAESKSEDFAVEGNREALQKLTWLYLKLLLAEQNIRTLDRVTTERKIREQLMSLEKDLSSAKLSAPLKESKDATRRILRQRLAHLERREETLQEIESDLVRIEAQVDLAVDSAGMKGKPETISANIDLVSQLLDDSLFGESSASVAVLEETYGSSAR